MQLTTEEAPAAFFELASDEQLDWVPPTAEWAAENADVRIVVMADANTRALSQADPKKQARAQKARKPLMETSMKRAADGRAPLGADAVPDARLRRRGGHVAVAPTRTSTTAPAWSTDDDPVTAWQRQSDEVKRLAEWIEGKEEVHITAPGHRHQARRRRPHLDPVRRARTTCPTASSSPGPSRTRSTARSRSRSRPPTAAARSSGVKFRFEGGKVVDASAERGEDFLIEMLDTDEGARRLGELGHRHQLRHRHRHQGDPARREDRRHRPHGDRR